MDTFEFHSWLIALLTDHGWIARVEANRQDVSIDWTELGQGRGRDFIENVKRLVPDKQWDERDLERLRDFGVYVGFIEQTRRDRTLAKTAGLITSKNVLVVATASSGHRRYRLFTARGFDEFYEFIESQQDDGREVMVIAIEDIVASNVGKAYPFGKHQDRG